MTGFDPSCVWVSHLVTGCGLVLMRVLLSKWSVYSIVCTGCFVGFVKIDGFILVSRMDSLFLVLVLGVVGCCGSVVLFG